MKVHIKEACKMFFRDIINNKWVFWGLALLWLPMWFIGHTICPVRFCTGYPCPGCGLVHAGFHLFFLHPERAWEYNPTIFLWIPFLLYLAFCRYFRREKKKQKTVFLIIVVFVTVFVYVYRFATVFPKADPMIYNGHNIMSGVQRLLLSDYARAPGH